MRVASCKIVSLLKLTNRKFFGFFIISYKCFIQNFHLFQLKFSFDGTLFSKNELQHKLNKKKVHRRAKQDKLVK